MSNKLIRVGISQGDINGIGLEVIIKTFLDPVMMELCTPVLFSSQKTVSYHRKTMGVEDFNFNVIKDFNSLHTKRPNLYSCYEEEVNMDPGKSTPSGGKYALISLQMASEALSGGQVDVLVTAPINKHNIQSDIFTFKGHTEYLEQRFGEAGGALMLMVSESLKVGLVTGHVPVADISSLITAEKIEQKLKVLNKTLIQDFGIRKPKIAVLGLNPHAGDAGSIGNEEQTIIVPAIKSANEQNMMVYGPYPADGFFGASSYSKFDAVLAMYHDQGLIPFKALAFHSGVNYTAGISVIRTSPDHGTAYDLAGKNTASEESFRRAVYLACDIFKTRDEYRHLTSNTLKNSPARMER